MESILLRVNFHKLYLGLPGFVGVCGRFSLFSNRFSLLFQGNPNNDAAMILKS